MTRINPYKLKWIFLKPPQAIKQKLIAMKVICPRSASMMNNLWYSLAQCSWFIEVCSEAFPWSYLYTASLSMHKIPASPNFLSSSDNSISSSSWIIWSSYFTKNVFLWAKSARSSSKLIRSTSRHSSNVALFASKSAKSRAFKRKISQVSSSWQSTC